MFNKRLEILTKETFSFGSLSFQWLMAITVDKAPVCVCLARLLQAGARSLPPLRAPHLLTQPCLHVHPGSPCGICWGGGGKTMVSFTHRLSKPGAISLGLAEESSTLLKLFNPCSAKPLCRPRAMRELVCREEIFSLAIVSRFKKAQQEGQVILKIHCPKTDSQSSIYCTRKIILTKAMKTHSKYHQTTCHLKIVSLPLCYLALDKIK